MFKSKRKTGRKSKSKKFGGTLTFRKFSTKIKKAVRRADTVEDAVMKAVRVAERMKKASCL